MYCFLLYSFKIITSNLIEMNFLLIKRRNKLIATAMVKFIVIYVALN